MILHEATNNQKEFGNDLSEMPALMLLDSFEAAPETDESANPLPVLIFGSNGEDEDEDMEEDNFDDMEEEDFDDDDDEFDDDGIDDDDDDYEDDDYEDDDYEDDDEDYEEFDE